MSFFKAVNRKRELLELRKHPNFTMVTQERQGDSWRVGEKMLRQSEKEEIKL